ncbi:BTB and MATH domain-containing protein 38-like [Acropora millepora]|uniref:BTB and MATH domain-containing protein 38-like n=1 Tax=Acropora millepora TaxID=45264 RepID=UPI001CF200DB|nr:BTB and MATH domain-containing protein 38-like [Acropora millepora]
MNPSNESIEEVCEDFSQPWKPSDLVLLVEGGKLQVHRDILALSSPVFSRMLQGDFKEKTAQEISLPGKKFHEMREMLLVIYPTTEKSVNEINCYFLLALADEYQVSTVIEKCKRCLLEALKNKQGSDILDMLFVAQLYSLENVLDECIKKTEEVSFVEMKRHTRYGQIEPLSQRKMIELRLLKVEAENDWLKRLACDAQNQWDVVVRILGAHLGCSSQWAWYSVDRSLQAIKDDTKTNRKSYCACLRNAYEPLRIAANKLHEIQGRSQPYPDPREEF